MRAMLLLSIASYLLSVGCSSQIAYSGLELSTLSTREMAQAKFGAPEKTEILDGKLVEHYHTRRKLREHGRSQGMGMAAGLSFGVSEVFFLPPELCLLTSRTLFGQDIQIHYAEDGVIDHFYVSSKGDLLFGPIGEDKPYKSADSED